MPSLLSCLVVSPQQGDRGSRKRYLPSDKDRPGSPASKRMAMSPDRGRDKRNLGRPPMSPQMDRPRGQGPRPAPPQGDRSVQPSACCCDYESENII
ncbi:hypothetical protein AMECASPLE_036682 [Ameca splendens]|uniref:Uncharacterized protein n=1 Tax=Ameca splendens TaxID=208324 RepID=A0ABV0YUT2_9TELE